MQQDLDLGFKSEIACDLDSALARLESKDDDDDEHRKPREARGNFFPWEIHTKCVLWSTSTLFVKKFGQPSRSNALVPGHVTDIRRRNEDLV